MAKESKFKSESKDFPTSAKQHRAGNAKTKNAIPLSNIRSKPPNKVIDYSSDTIEGAPKSRNRSVMK